MTDQEGLAEKWTRVVDILLRSPWLERLYEQHKRSKHDKVLVHDFLNLARTDLQAARLLHERSQYSLAVFHVQQSVEKAAKAFALDLGMITRKELRDVGHSSPSAFLTLLGKQIGIEYAALVESIFPAILDGYSKAKRIVKEKGEEIAKLPAEEIMSRLNICRQLSARLPSLLRQVFYSLGTLLKGKAGSAGIPEIESSRALGVLREKFEKIEQNGADKFLRGFVVLPTLYMLSVLTFPHESCSRYPDLDIRPSDYDETLGIVQTMNEVMNEVDKAIEDVSLSIE